MFNIGLKTLLPLMVLLVFELIYRGSFGSTLNWIIDFPNQFFVSYAILFSIINIFYVLPRRLYIACGIIFISFFSLAGFISRQKLLLRGEPLLPWDFSLGKEALNITASFHSLVPYLVPIFIFFIMIGAVTFLLSFVPKEEYRPGTKILTAALSFFLFLSLVAYIPLQQTFSFRLINWSQKMNYEENGMTLGFILNARNHSVNKPGGYEQTVVKEIIGQSNPSYPVDPDFKPNIILVMSEAFWDPTVLEGVSFSEDPIPFFRSLHQSYSGGTLLTPVYGGGTANTEFEVLTGLSTSFLPPGITPYVQYVHKPLEALPAIFKRQGYEATAIHTYHNWFYRRNIVYQDLGFDKFISQEFFINPEYNGAYIRDTELTKKILRVIEQSENPDFVFALSMQAHGPYSGEANPDNRIKVSGDLRPETKAILENYTNIISDVDLSLKLLIEGLEQLGEPSAVVFFGDHLPMLGRDYDVYRETGFFLDESSYTDYLRKYTVPFVIWDNFSAQKENLRLSASFLGSHILKMSKKEGSPLTDFLNTLIENGTGMLPCPHYLQEENISQEEFSRYRLLQYDFLIGNEYAYLLKPLNKPAQNPFYLLGYNPATIENVFLPDSLTLEVQGKNFSPHHQIFVNDKPLSTTFTSENLLTGQLIESPIDRPEVMEVQVRMTDSMKNVISRSNIYSGSLNNN